MKLTINLMRVTIMTLIALTTSFATYAIAQKNVVTFTIPDGYNNSLYGLCKDLALPIDTITKYNPIFKDNGLYIGASISLPANYVNMELLTEKGFTPSLLENAYDVQFSHLNNRPNTAMSSPENPSKSKLNTNGSADLPAVIPSKIESAKTLKKFFSNFPSFKCKETGVTLTLTSNGACFFAYVDGKLLGKFEVDVNKEYPTKALIGLPWLNGWGPAPMVLSLNGENTTLSLLPVEGEENLSYNSRGYLQHGRTGNKTWMQLSLSSDGISFTPVDYKPNPEIFHFTGFLSPKNPDNENSIIYTE